MIREYMVITSKQLSKRLTPTPLVIGSNQIAPSPSVRSLGITFDQYVSMEKHVNNICHASYLQLKNISKLKGFLDVNPWNA
jgi:hypothetical protein